MTKKSVIDKATRDKPVWFEMDPDKPGILVILHGPSGFCICTRGWTLNEVLAIMEWALDDVFATFKRSWSKDRGAYNMTPGSAEVLDLSKLNEQGG